jgi:hypothetical protein
LQVNECTTELKANLQEEHLAGMEFIGTVFKTILSPLQKARAIVQSYPFYPDVYQASRRSGHHARSQPAVVCVHVHVELAVPLILLNKRGPQGPLPVENT